MSNCAQPAGPRIARGAARRFGVALLLLALVTIPHEANAQPCNLQGTWDIVDDPFGGWAILLDDGSGTLSGVARFSGSDTQITGGSYVHPSVSFNVVGLAIPVAFAGSATDCETIAGTFNAPPPASPFATTLERRRTTYCGDGVRQAADGEQCDDGNFVNGDACSSTCLLTQCGDGNLDPFEECDLGTANAVTGACRTDCQWASCGDGARFAGPVPPGAPVQIEECDLGALNSSAPNAGCRPGCVGRRCGDGARDEIDGERCDDGNLDPGDGCDAFCKSELVQSGTEFSVVDLGAVTGLGPSVEYVTMNELGQIAGTYGEEYQPFFWDGAVAVDLGPIGALPLDLNEAGQVAGDALGRAFVWQGGTFTDIHGLGDETTAWGINASGAVSGTVVYPGGTYRAFRWQGGVMTDLGTFPGGTLSQGIDINDAGDVAVTGNIAPSFFQRAQLLRANGTWIDLGTLGGDQSTSWAINDAGQVVGDAQSASAIGHRAFLYSGGPLIDLGVLGGESSTARGINNFGQIVGYSTIDPTNNAQHGFLHDCRGMMDLNDLVSSSLELRAADYRINDAGQIVGSALDDAAGVVRAVRLDPLPFCGNCRVTPASGEQCDDGNTLDGDGCSSTCTLESTTVSGSGTVTTGAIATPSTPAQAVVTSPSGGVVEVTRTSASGGPSGIEVLGVRFAVTAPAETAEIPLQLVFRIDPSLVPAGQSLAGLQVYRDGIALADCAGAPPHAVASPDPCVSTRALQADGDLEIVTLSSHASEWAFGFAVCPAVPDPSCRVPTAAKKSTVQIKKGAQESQDKFAWKWSKGAATTTADFGNPTGTKGLDVCVYDARDGAPALQRVVRIPGGGLCAGKPCWKASRKGFVFKSRAGTADGVQQVSLTAGAAGRSSVQVKAGGAALPDFSLPATAPVTVQLRSGSGVCWGATFSTPGRVPDPARQFKGSSD